VEQLISSMDEVRDGGYPLLNHNALPHLVERCRSLLVGSPLAALTTFGAWEQVPSNRIESKKELRVGSLTLDPRSLDVTVHERPLNLTRKEPELLRFLLSHRDYLGKANLLDGYIRPLRSKLRPVGGEGRIQTLQGTGGTSCKAHWGRRRTGMIETQGDYASFA
jgi:DNA-binding response OmpR family regulator